MSLSSQLWSDNAVVAADVLAHRFVGGIGDGSLPRDLFARYIAQDAFFLESFARAYALALARSQDTATLLTLADLLTGVRQELGLHPPGCPVRRRRRRSTVSCRLRPGGRADDGRVSRATSFRELA